jgi:hypothetical protein
VKGCGTTAMLTARMSRSTCNTRPAIPARSKPPWAVLSELDLISLCRAGLPFEPRGS